MDLISVIVPVYKVEAYLDKCVQSIVDQTYQNLEIILVDDGSPDRCGAMCDAWTRKDDRIKVIHKKNGGLSDARNAGMAVAVGQYIAFVDSDDWINADYLHHLYRAVQENGAGIAACDIQFVEEGEEVFPPSVCTGYRSCTAMEALAELITGKGFRAVAWNKLYHRSYLESERYPVGKHHEDEFFTYRILAKTEKLAYVDLPLYYYLQRSGSIMHTVSMKRLDALDAHLERLSFLREYYPSLYTQDKISFCIACTSFYCLGLELPDESRAAFLEKICCLRRKVHFTWKELAAMSGKHLIQVLGSGFALDLFCRFLNLRK